MRSMCRWNQARIAAFTNAWASDLHWLRGARIKYGADIRVLDMSAGGMMVETSSQLAPDANLVVELLGPESPILVPSRVLRCRTASLGEILKYQGACAFKRPLTIPELPAERIVEQQAVARPVAAAPSVGWQKVVARFNDGRIVAGYTNDFHPSKQQLHLFPNPRQGESTFIPLTKSRRCSSCASSPEIRRSSRARTSSIRRRDARWK
jgi:hypothetical protein